MRRYTVKVEASDGSAPPFQSSGEAPDDDTAYDIAKQAEREYVEQYPDAAGYTVTITKHRPPF